MAARGTDGQKLLVRVRPWASRCASSCPRPAQLPRPSFSEKDVLHTDNHTLFINKPAGLLSQSDRTGDVDVAALAREYVRVAANKPGEAFVALVHRLDRPVSGVMCVARTSKAAARLSASFRAREGVEKIYHAVVAGSLTGSGTRRDFMVSPEESSPVARHGRGPRTRAVTPAFPSDFNGGGGGAQGGRGGGGDAVSTSAGKLAELEWEAVGLSPSAAARLRCPLTGSPRTVVRVRLITGRKHQIRAQLSEMGHPVVGDVRYGGGIRRGGPPPSPPNQQAVEGSNRDGATAYTSAMASGVAMQPLADRSILLHASELILPHPTQPGILLRAAAAPPEAWSMLCGREVIEEAFGGLSKAARSI